MKAALLLLLAVYAHPFSAAFKSTLLDFAYAYPRQAGAVPLLNTKLQAEYQRDRAQALLGAREDRRLASHEKRPFHTHYFHAKWSLTGETPQLIVLLSRTDTYTGGARGGTAYSAMLWDRRRNQEIALGDLLEPPRDLASAHQRFCKLLDAERLKRRNGERLTGEFGRCPGLSELVIAPADKDGNGRFDRLRIIAPEYVAGPYVEGEYDLWVAVTPQLIGEVRRKYRASFEVQRQ